MWRVFDNCLGRSRDTVGEIKTKLFKMGVHYTAGPIMYLKSANPKVVPSRDYLHNEKKLFGKMSHPNIIDSAPALAKPMNDFFVMARFGTRLAQLPDEFEIGIGSWGRFFGRVEKGICLILMLEKDHPIGIDDRCASAARISAQDAWAFLQRNF